LQAIDRQIILNTSKNLVRYQMTKARTGLYPLVNLFLFITMRCNAKCGHCFCWQDLNVGIPEFTLDQIEKIAETVPPHEQLILTGGEPIIRRDLLEVMDAFARRGKVRMFKVNTNALNPDKMIKLTHDFKKMHPYVGLDFQVSLDGLPETHDKIRGVPGNFNKVLRAFKEIYPLKQVYPALEISCLTVINNLNYKEILPLNDLLRKEVDGHIDHGLEIIRDIDTTAWNVLPEVRENDYKPMNIALPPREAFDQIQADIDEINRRSGIKANAYRLHSKAVFEMVKTGKPQYPCRVAGEAVGVIYSNGDVAHCEMTKSFANLKDFDYDFSALWNSDAANARRCQIKNCYCTHGSFHGKSVEFSWKGVAGLVRQSITGS